VSEADYLTDRTHMLITGVTGSRTNYGGKTSLATWWADTHGRASTDVVLYLNVKLDEPPEEHAGVVARNLQEVGEAIGEGHQFVCFSPMDHDWEDVSVRFRDFVARLDRDLEKLVVLDEGPELDEDAILWFLRVAGNGNNCKTLLLSQEPGAVPGRGQCSLVWVGPVQENQRHVFRANNRENHFDAMQREHEPYHWSVLTGPGDDDRDHYRPVPEKYA